MENKYIKIIELEQHTPMWHFQPTETDCCLRASEVKPKLDRFLAKKLYKNEVTSFNYKMSFIPIGKKEIIEDSYINNNRKKANKFPLYFGNINKNNKQLVFYPEGIEMKLFSFDSQLLEDIVGCLNNFFACTSFGTRQNKGFGFFYPKNKEFDDSAASYLFDVPVDKSKYDELFNYIYYFHKMIRSGINEKKAYYKSFMYHYALNCGENWDKPVIRHHFQLFNPVYEHICGIPSTDPRIKDKYKERQEMKDNYIRLKKDIKYRNSPWLFREAIGLSNAQIWRDYDDTIIIESTNHDIKRFKSPITYRPVPAKGKYNIYLYITDIPQKYMDTTFEIKDKPKTGPGKTPMADMKIYDKFSLEGYLDFVINHCHICKSIGNNQNSYADHIFKRGENGYINFRKIKRNK